MQTAARRVLEENQRLKMFLKSKGISDQELEGFDLPHGQNPQYPNGPAADLQDMIGRRKPCCSEPGPGCSEGVSTVKAEPTSPTASSPVEPPSTTNPPSNHEIELAPKPQKLGSHEQQHSIPYPPPSLGPTKCSTTDTTPTHPSSQPVDAVFANKPHLHPDQTPAYTFLPSYSSHQPYSHPYDIAQSAPPTVTTFSHMDAYASHTTPVNVSISSSKDTPAFAVSQHQSQTMSEEDLLSPELQANFMAVLGQSSPTALDGFSHLQESGHDTE